MSTRFLTGGGQHQTEVREFESHTQAFGRTKPRHLRRIFPPLFLAERRPSELAGLHVLHITLFMTLTELAVEAGDGLRRPETRLLDDSVRDGAPREAGRGSAQGAPDPLAGAELPSTIGLAK